MENLGYLCYGCDRRLPIGPCDVGSRLANECFTAMHLDGPRKAFYHSEDCYNIAKEHPVFNPTGVNRTYELIVTPTETSNEQQEQY